jgi:hypothetical protein
MADKYALVGSGFSGDLPGGDEAFVQASAEIAKNKAEFAPDEVIPHWCGTCQEVNDVAHNTNGG